MMNYGDLDKKYSDLSDAKVVLLPVPFDATSTWIKGADNGPAAILEASANMELYDIQTDSEVYLQGIYTAPPMKGNLSPEDLHTHVKESVSNFLDQGKFTVVIGGEHSVSSGTIQAHAEKHPGMCVLQLDAHTDLRDEYHGSKYNHACVMARAKEHCPIIQVGIRSMDSGEKKSIDRDNVFFIYDIRNGTDWMKRVISRLADKVYITFDLDVLDPSIMPSTGTPEPGGLLWDETIDFLRMVIEEKELVGFDVVELCPNPSDKAPDFLAAKLIYKMLSYRFEGSDPDDRS